MEAYLISVAIKSTVLLTAGTALLWLLRQRDPSIRHVVCLLTLATAASTPFVALWSPHWSFLILVPAAVTSGMVSSNVGNQAANWPMLLAAMWVLGTLAMSVRMAGGLILLGSLRRRSEHFRNGETAEIRIGDVTAPLTCGTLRPIILLPRAARSWNDMRLRTVLLHESAHVRRRDCLVNYLALVTRALLWWNPLSWIIAGRLEQERELVCDDAVLAAGVAADVYAAVLLDVARECSRSLILGCAIGINRNRTALRRRFSHLFERREMKTPSTRRMAIAIPLLLALMTTVSFADKIYKIGPGIVPPKVLIKSEPQYTDEARDAKIEGPVVLTIVVGSDQRAHDVRVIRSLDPGLDASAIQSIQTWWFQPGMKDGKPVDVEATVQVNFRLR